MRDGKTTSLLSSWFVFVVLILPVISAYADEAKNESSHGVSIQQVDKPVSAVYDKLYKSLEDAYFFVVFEPNIGKNLARFSEKWGDDYNRNNISVIRSMIFCNGWYANKVSNLDPDMLGFCPLHLTLIEREGKTTVLFNRPGAIAQNSPARELFLKIEGEVIEAIRQGLE
ncbi:MAG: hypothetical protein BMS9Abin19_1011 [Gammaproteobacteria bacterium]|nr:MAG: hypothetical protein BMS9Abin19_1011 [Gammaproteobacteria bacterium]